MRILAAAGLTVALACAAAPALAAQADKDAEFLRKAVQGDTTEIKMGEMAQKMGASPQVKALGARLVRDHTEARAKAEAAARALRIEAPETVSPEGAKTADRLAKLGGSAFDREWLKAAVKDHKEDVKAYDAEIKHGRGPAQAHARETLPVIQQHLTAAEADLNAMKG